MYESTQLNSCFSWCKCCFLLFLYQALTPNSEASGRELNPDERSAYFRQNDFSYLNINPVGTSLVVQSIECALTCLQLILYPAFLSTWLLSRVTKVNIYVNTFLRTSTIIQRSLSRAKLTTISASG